jgi:Family of unknown function (DUF6074)
MSTDRTGPSGASASNRIIGSHIVERAPRARGAGAAAAIIAFPIEHQRNVIAKIAGAMMRKRSAEAADQCIAKALRQYTADMRRQGMPTIIVRREVHTMEAQVRAAVWRLMFPWVNQEKPPKPHRRRGRSSRRRSAGQLKLFDGMTDDGPKGRGCGAR